MDGETAAFLLVLLVLGGFVVGAALVVWIASLARRVSEMERRSEATEDQVRFLTVMRPREETVARPAVPPAPERSEPTPPVPASAPWSTAWPTPSPPPPPLAPVIPPRPVEPPSPIPAAPPAPAGAGTLESFFGGRVLLVIGVVAVLFGLGFFLKLAIERGLFPQEARLALGAAGGIAALVAGDRIRARGLSVFGQALMGGGLGALFLCDAFASVRYGFYDRPAAFALAAAVSLTGVVLALRRDAPFLAWLGFAGAFLAPAILGRDEDAIEGLTLWLAAADLGVAGVLAFRAWRGIDVLAAVATAVYFLAWRVRWFSDERIGAAATCLAALAAVLLVLALGPPIRARRTLGASYATLMLATGFPLVLGADLFVPDHRTAFGLAAVAGAVVIAGAAEGLQRRSEAPSRDVEGVRAFAYAVLLAAVPIVLEGDAVAPAWAAVGAAAFVAGSSSSRPWLAAGGFVAVSLAAIRVLSRLPLHDDESFAPFLNGAFLAAAAPPAAFAVGGLALRRRWPGAVGLGDLLLAAATIGIAALGAYETWLTLAPRGTPWRDAADALAAATAVAVGIGLAAAACVRGRGGAGGLAAWGPLALAVVLGIVAFAVPRPLGHTFAANLLFGAGALVAASLFAASALGVRPPTGGRIAGATFLFLVLTAEWLFWGDRGRPAESREDTRFAAQVGLSASWALFAAALVLLGFLRRAAGARWAGIAVFLLTVAKVFLFDLADLATPYRVASFLALGALLVGVSYAYQRARRAAPPAGPA